MQACKIRQILTAELRMSGRLSFVTVVKNSFPDALYLELMKYLIVLFDTLFNVGAFFSEDLNVSFLVSIHEQLLATEGIMM